MTTLTDCDAVRWALRSVGDLTEYFADCIWRHGARNRVQMWLFESHPVNGPGSLARSPERASAVKGQVAADVADERLPGVVGALQTADKSLGLGARLLTNKFVN